MLRFLSSLFQKPRISPNFGERKGDVRPSMLIMHYMAVDKASALDILCDPAMECSAHYLIEENGKIHNLVPEEKRAWHAGVSCWAGESDVNSHSIGVEVIKPESEESLKPYPEPAIKALISLSKTIMARWNIPPPAVLGHSDIAPGRKIDPGPLFPWERLAVQGIGLWPAPVEMDYQAAEDLILNPKAVKELLTGFGYNPDLDYETLINAFMRHFHPEKFEDWQDCPEPDILTIARLLSLIRMKGEVSRSDPLQA